MSLSARRRDQSNRFAKKKLAKAVVKRMAGDEAAFLEADAAMPGRRPPRVDVIHKAPYRKQRSMAFLR